MCEKFIKQQRSIVTPAMTYIEEYLLGRNVPKVSEVNLQEGNETLSVSMLDGDLCELDGSQRCSEIKFVCDVNQAGYEIASVTETQLCKYVVIVASKNFCDSSHAPAVINCSSESDMHRLSNEMDVSPSFLEKDNIVISMWTQKLVSIVFGLDPSFPLIKNITKELTDFGSELDENTDSQSFKRWMKLMGIDVQKLIAAIEVDDDEKRKKEKA